MTKKRKWILPVCIVAGVIAFLSVAFFIFAAIMTSKGYGMSAGRILVARDDSYMLIVDENSPIRMSDRSEDGGLFERLTVGDRVLVIHTGIADSYPAQTGAYWILKLGEGSLDDIPDKIIADLTQMGWLSSAREDGFSFSLTFGTYGESSFDSETGRLIKTTNATTPSDYVTNLLLSESQLQEIYQMIRTLDIRSYPNVYDPINDPSSELRTVSEPSMSLILTVRTKDFEKTVSCEEIAYGASGYDERAQAFLDVCEHIKELVTSSDEWAALPEYEFFYD